MSCLKIRSKEVNSYKVNEEILRRREKAAERLRNKLGRTVMGRAKLMSQPILKPHKPKKKDRKIFVFASDKEHRINFIEEFNRFCELCSWCFQEWKKGNLLVKWPPGAFKPPLPPNMNLLPCFG